MKVGYVVVAALVFMGCGSSGGDSGSPPTDTSADVPAIPDSTPPTPDITPPSPDATIPADVTYHAHVRALMEKHCVTCHEPDGVGPFPLTSYAEVAPLATLIVGSVTSGSMPPWMPDPDCRTFGDERLLTGLEIDTIVAWEEDGAPEGEPSDYPGPPDTNPSVDPPDLMLDGGAAYTMNPLLPDDYRCFPLNHTFSEATYIIGSNVYPDQKSVVHHVLFYAVGPDATAALAAKDAADAGLGYQCFGGPSVGDTPLLGGWVPGMQPVFFPKGAVIPVEAGSQIVMQIHYNALGIADPSTVGGDLTKVGLWTLDSNQKPTHLIRIDPLANGGIFIAAGDPNSVHQQTFPFPVGATLIGVAPHMHLLGTRIAVQHKSVGGGQQTCLVDIPEWDFNWQQFYWYQESEHLPLVPGDQFELTCEYDNSTSNQPVVNGEQLSPKDVVWGEGTLDEMCLNYIVTMSPAPGDSVCSTLPPCSKACPTGDSDCFLSCYAQSGTDCLSCVGDPLVECLKEFCLAQVAVLGQCLDECSESTLACLGGTCATTFHAAYGCIEPHLESGACDGHLAPCDLIYGD